VATRIDPRLRQKLQERLGVSQPRLYQLIAATASQLMLDNRLAAIALARSHGVNVNRFASSADLAEIRGSYSAAVRPTAPPGPTPTTVRKALTKLKKKKNRAKQKNAVWVVHGRNTQVRDSLFAFLRAIGLTPLEFSKAVRRTKKAAPYVGEILDAAFANIAAVVVLLTPDDQARLKRKFLHRRDPAYERRLTGQARPNVLFEAGTAFGSHPRSTVLVEVGDLRPFSDIAGRHVVRLRNDAKSRVEFADRLRVAGCDVVTDGTDWLTVGNFASNLT
jgi:predicted nucleotide-binding protein